MKAPALHEDSLEQALLRSVHSTAVTINGPYGRLVRAQTRQNPCLENLRNFLSDGRELRNVCRIESLEFFADHASPVRRNIDVSKLDFKGHLDLGSQTEKPEESPMESDCESSRDDTDNLLGRLLIVEDLTRGVVEALGGWLDIDPMFFASHIHSPWVNARTQTPDAATLPSRTRPHVYTNIHYHRTITFKDVSLHARKLLRTANVHRKVIILPSIKGTRIGLVQQCVSVYKTVTNRGWIGMWQPGLPKS